LGIEDPLAISSAAHTHLKELLWRIWHALQAAPELEAAQELPVYRPDDDPRAFSIRQVDDGWRVQGAAIERAAAMTYWEHEGSVRRFQRIMETLGIEKALRDAGVEEGDTVHVGEFELEWSD
ncbi:MAG TPA: Obg family GTPase CgtA, partial [Anaerolineaceae bacterium]|nr:Obg family GTPase CgtA [Anaerolineaceae bacterium]